MGSMDEKLARGLSRALFYRLAKESPGDPWTPVHSEVLKAYYENGGIREADLTRWGLALDNAVRKWPDISVERQLIRHPIKRKVVVGLTWPYSGKSGGQNWLTTRCAVYIFQRKSLQVINTFHNVGIAQHAVFRIFQRGNGQQVTASDLLNQATLWTPIILFVLLRLEGDDTEVAIPFKDGLLLGAIEIANLADDKGPMIDEIGLRTHSRRALRVPFESEDGDIATVALYTYIGPDEMFPNQIKLYSALADFEKRYRNTMVRLRDTCSLGFPDEAVTKIMKPVNLSSIENETINELGTHMRAFFESAEWKRHVQGHRPRRRYPNSQID